MPYLLNAAYLIALVVLAPWVALTAWRTGKYRAGYAEKFWGRVPRRSGTRPCLWLHAVSVGEVNLLRTLVEALERQRPELELVVSTTTKAGHELALARFPQLTVFYCPLDFSWAVREAMARVRPSLLVLAELELWPNLLCAARERCVPVAVVNGRLSDRSFRGYRRVRALASSMLHKVDLVAAQNAEYAERFLALGADPQSVRITGSMKYDGANTRRDNRATMDLRALAGFTPNDIVFLAGSTQDPEESLALAAFRELSPRFPKLRLVLVPRHPERFSAVAAMLTAEGVRFQRRTELATQGADPAARVLLVDVVGELGAWWGTANIAFVGGSLTQRGGQNMIEPAAYGAAVSFGPNTRNFRDIVAALLAAEAAVVVRDGAELTQFVRHCLEHSSFAHELGERAHAFVLMQLGATDRTVTLLGELIDQNAAPVAVRPAA